MDIRFTFYDTNIDKIDMGCVKDAYGDKRKSPKVLNLRTFGGA